mmetsp:Transcript_25595/g.41508  ORF Transcript_25595/g.41508 Transcript_25595/m.41508 type:complete len:205 (+) Transcript_25595:1260-1874(+)
MAIRLDSPGLGPMVPKTGIIWNCVAQCAMMCSASSILPVPVAPSMTTKPPSAKGLPAGALERPTGVEPMVCSGECITLLKGPPSISATFTLAVHFCIEQRCCTFVLAVRTGSLEVRLLPSRRLSYQGNRIFRSMVTPQAPAASRGTGWKIGMGFAFPFTLIGASALKIISPVECLLVSIKRADKLTQSPKTVYSILLALPQTPQ